MVSNGPLLIMMIDVVRKAVARVPVHKFRSLDLVFGIFHNNAVGSRGRQPLQSLHLRRPILERCPVVCP